MKKNTELDNFNILKLDLLMQRKYIIFCQMELRLQNHCSSLIGILEYYVKSDILLSYTFFQHCSFKCKISKTFVEQ